MIVYHKNRGAGTITAICRALQKKNPDSTSIFVEFTAGEPEEVTKDLLTYPSVVTILEMWMDASLYITGEMEAKIPSLKRARTLTGLYLSTGGC